MGCPSSDLYQRDVQKQIEVLATDSYHSTSSVSFYNSKQYFSDLTVPVDVCISNAHFLTASSSAKHRKALRHPPPHRTETLCYNTSCKKRSAYLCLIVNIHYIDRSVAITHKKISVFFRLQDLQQVNIGTTINENKILELQTKPKQTF